MIYHPLLGMFLVPLLLLKLILVMFLLTTELAIASTHFAARLSGSLTEGRLKERTRR